MPLLKRIPVSVGSRKLEVRIGSSHLPQLGRLLRKMGLGSQAVVLTNRTVMRLHGKELSRSLAHGGHPPLVLTVEDSERSKSWKTLGRVLDRLADWDGPGRRPFLILFGGGVVGDLGGVAAGLYKRGIPYVQVPTTLLAQVDSSVGGKTGVDLPHGKNLVGLIVQPRLVFIELKFLSSLPRRQFRSGLAEAIKCGVIGDGRLFSLLERSTLEQLQGDPRRLAQVVARSVGLKVSVVQRDEDETRGIRTILNFGHTLGHALETATGYSRATTHGEAVALGMLAASRIARRLKLLSPGEEARIAGLLRRFGFPMKVRGAGLKAVFRAMAHDKKWAAGKNRWVLPTGIGRCTVRQGVPERIVRESILEIWRD